MVLLHCCVDICQKYGGPDGPDATDLAATCMPAEALAPALEANCIGAKKLVLQVKKMANKLRYNATIGGFWRIYSVFIAYDWFITANSDLWMDSNIVFGLGQIFDI